MIIADSKTPANTQHNLQPCNCGAFLYIYTSKLSHGSKDIYGNRSDSGSSTACLSVVYGCWVEKEEVSRKAFIKNNFYLYTPYSFVL